MKEYPYPWTVIPALPDDPFSKGYHNPPQLLCVSGFETVIKAGKGDEKYLYEDGEDLVFLTLNGSLGYAGFERFDPKLSLQSSVFVQGGQVEEIFGDSGLPDDPDKIAAYLVDYLSEDEASLEDRPSRWCKPDFAMDMEAECNLEGNPHAFVNGWEISFGGALGDEDPREHYVDDVYKLRFMRAADRLCREAGLSLHMLEGDRDALAEKLGEFMAEKFKPEPAPITDEECLTRMREDEVIDDAFVPGQHEQSAAVLEDLCNKHEWEAEGFEDHDLGDLRNDAPEVHEELIVFLEGYQFDLTDPEDKEMAESLFGVDFEEARHRIEADREEESNSPSL